MSVQERGEGGGGFAGQVHQSANCQESLNKQGVY